MTSIRVVVLVLLAYVLTGCDEPQPDAATPTPTASACPSQKPDAIPERTLPTGLAPVALGQPQSTAGSGIDVELIVYAYKQPAGPACPNPGHPGHTWAAFDLRACVKAIPAGFDFRLGWAQWRLVFADGTTTRPNPRSVPGLEQPEYPDGKALSTGQCERGWITLPVPVDKRPTTVLYFPISEARAWAVPPA